MKQPTRSRWTKSAPALLLAAAIFISGFTAPTQAHHRAGITPLTHGEVDSLVQDYVRAHPDIIASAMAAIRRQQREEAQKQRSAELRRISEPRAGDPVLGNDRGEVTLVEFTDYQCGSCKEMSGKLAGLIAADPGLRLVIKEYPILGAPSPLAARASLASVRQDLYEPFHHALMEIRGSLTEANIYQAALEVGLDIARLRRDMADPAIARTIDRTGALAASLGLQGVPAFIVGGQIIPGGVRIERLAEAIASARER